MANPNGPFLNPGFSFPPNATGRDSFTREEPLLTVKQMKERYLFGINLTDEAGNPIPDTTLQHHINAAVSYLEHKLDILIFPTEITERYDYRQIDYTEFNFIQLKKRPASNVTSLKVQYTSFFHFQFEHIVHLEVRLL